MIANIHGREFEVQDEPADYWGWIKEGRYDHEWKMYDTYLKPEHSFIDVGAWVGAHSLYAGKVAKSVLAVEPDPVACEILCKNLPDESDVYRLAISDHAGKVKLGSGLLGASTTRENPNEGRGIGPWADDQTFEVECSPLRSVACMYPEPLFIKIDCEGSEEKILTDREFFKDRRPIVYIELHPFWWKDEAQTRRDFDQVCQLYSKVEQVTSESFLLA